jgi:hypothetical protein
LGQKWDSSIGLLDSRLNFVVSAQANKNGKHGTPESHARNDGKAERLSSLGYEVQPTKNEQSEIRNKI